jgi:hypothetical protein
MTKSTVRFCAVYRRDPIAAKSNCEQAVWERLGSFFTHEVTMQNTFTPQAVEIVKQAIDLDNLGEYEKALGLYRRALEFFMTGLKYEQNPAARKMILERVDGYMKRAEEIKNVLASTSGPPPSKDGGGGAKTMNKNDAKNGKGDDDEQAKMRGALSSAIVSEKPNVKWDDVAGLEGAKEALKEGCTRSHRVSAAKLFTLPFCRLLRSGRAANEISSGRIHRVAVRYMLTSLTAAFLSLALRRQEETLEGNSALRPSRNREVIPRQGRGHRGRLYVLCYVLLGPGVEVAGREREAGQADVRDGP